MTTPIQPAPASVVGNEGTATSSLADMAVANILADCGVIVRVADHWLPEELALIARGLTDLLRAAAWSPQACTRALGGVITLLRDRDYPIITDAAGTRYPVLGLYDAQQRTLTINNWSFDARTGGEEGGQRILLHELAHAWDGRSHYRLSWWLRWLPGPRASGYANTSRFEDWAEAVMGTVYGADPGHEAFNQRHSLRRHYVRLAFRRYR